MALEGSLTIEDADYILQELDYELFRNYDNNYKPSTGNPRGGLINITINSEDKQNIFFHQWLLNMNLYDGKIYLPIAKGDIVHWQKEISFSGAYCVHLSEYFSNSGREQMRMRITISASAIEFGVDEKVKFTNIFIAKK